MSENSTRQSSPATVTGLLEKTPEELAPESEGSGARRLREARVGEFCYSEWEYQQLPSILRSVYAPSSAVRRAILYQRRRRRLQAEG